MDKKTELKEYIKLKAKECLSKSFFDKNGGEDYYIFLDKFKKELEKVKICKHNWEFAEKIYADWAGEYLYYTVSKCTKCGKRRVD